MAKGLEDLKVDREPIEIDTPDAEICAKMRRMSPAQTRALAEQVVIAEFGVVMRASDIERRIRGTLPWHPFKNRYANAHLYEDYSGVIPDRALLILHRAMKTNMFVKFTVYEASYERLEPRDPWLVGWLSAQWSIRRTEPDDRGIVLAYWD